MATVMQKIKDIEDEMARTQKNKATAHHLGLLKAKLAKLRRELLTPSSKGGGGAGEGFDVTKSGDSRVGLVGFPSVGKSTLLNKLTGTFSELLDLPGIIEGAKDGKGRGRQVISTARTCNCILIVLDAIKPITHKRLIEKELEGFGIRLNKEPPNLTFRKKDKGGLNLTSTATTTHLDLETVKAICSEYRIHNADITLRYDATADDLIDVIEGSRVYIPCIYVVNKIDQITLEELEILDKLPHYCPISAHLEWNLDGLLDKIWEYLSLTRIYTKPKGMNPDYEDPVILSSKKRTVEDFCNLVAPSTVVDDVIVYCRHLLLSLLEFQFQPTITRFSLSRPGDHRVVNDAFIRALTRLQRLLKLWICSLFLSSIWHISSPLRQRFRALGSLFFLFQVLRALLQVTSPLR
ncbi:hypothetical protein V8G54_008943 [Vigna mungo]|uniref:OBG-type G domain-containing protein n=1 Tax=Vigna mungo TaxID=3915 RepID=A0AAQ3P633_VIGMU